MDQTTVRPRFDGIDVLRGLSIIAVVLHHINMRMLLNDVPVQKLLPTQLDKILFWNGANGVAVFFAISGFLITTTALRRWNSLAELDIPSFYRLRFARIAPLLLALLLILSFLHLSGTEGFVIPTERASLPRALLAAVTFHINWLESARGYLPANWDVLWSLSVEEVFYLFFPLLCRWTKIRPILVAILLIFVATGPFARTILTKNELWADYGYLSCMDGIALGCLAAIVNSILRATRVTLWTFRLPGAAMMLLVMTVRPLANYLHLYQTGLDVTILALGTCLVMIAVAQEDRRGRWPTALLRWFGHHSYEVYLTHVFVVLWAVQVFVALRISAGWALVWYLPVLALTGLLGAIVARWYSEPMNKKLRRGMRPVISRSQRKSQQKPDESVA
jgi:peptidoglycan/LPS O-acetylase OafA/YrhL